MVFSECKLEHLDQQLFATELFGNHRNRAQLQIRKSITEGIAMMYNHFKDWKLYQVKKLSTHITAASDRHANQNVIQGRQFEGRSLMSGSTEEERLQNNLNPETQTEGQRLFNDTSVKAITVDFCIFSRHS